MFCVPIVGPTLDEIKTQIVAASHADLLEFRHDLFKGVTFDDIAHVRSQLSLPVLFTVRKDMEKYATLLPEYMDVTHSIERKLFNRIRARFPSIQWVVSYHNFHHTPRNLAKVVAGLKGASFHKVACRAHNVLDALRILRCVRTTPNLLGMGMGRAGEITRVLAAPCGSPWLFTPVEAKWSSAPGQLTLSEIQHYGIKRLSKKSGIYGLLGGDLKGSISHLVHNKVFSELGVDGVYVRLEAKLKELKELLHLAKEVGVRGISVTMPFKEAILPFLDEVDSEAQKIGAVNTLVLQEGKWVGYNTDGKGALEALERRMKVRDKGIVILGAGGSARAIAYEALQRGGKVVILNRTVARAKRVAQELGCAGGSLEALGGQKYDILINTMPDAKVDLVPGSVVMDIQIKNSQLLQVAKSKGCTLVFGYEMFIEQAALQYALWSLL